MQTVLDSPISPHQDLAEAGAGGKYFDFLSFDPRGINNTTPEFRCFPDAFNKQTWLLRFIDTGLLWDSESVVGLEWARASALGASCSADRAEIDIIPYVNTAQVVEDMVEIIEQEGERRAKEVQRPLDQSTEAGVMVSGIHVTIETALIDIDRQAVLERTDYRPGEEKIQFWGMSYGTTVGATFAAMHPDKVKLAKQSRWVSPTWTRNRLMCEGINVKPAWRQDFTFEKQQWDNTSHPLLVIGNTHDPGAPLAKAWRVSRELFPGSVVLQQDSEGHVSHATPSLCTAKIVRDYFQTGTLPAPGTVCQPEMKPFLGCVRDGGCRFEGDDARLWGALVELADPYGFSRKHDDDDDNDMTYLNLWSRYGHLGRV